MIKWKIVQVLIKLPPQKLVTALLLLFIAASLTSNSIVAAFFISNKKQSDTDHKIEIDYYKNLVKTKDSMSFIKDKNQMDFVQEQLKIGARHEWEIDSMKLVKINKK